MYARSALVSAIVSCLLVGTVKMGTKDASLAVTPEKPGEGDDLGFCVKVSIDQIEAIPNPPSPCTGVKAKISKEDLKSSGIRPDCTDVMRLAKANGLLPTMIYTTFRAPDDDGVELPVNLQDLLKKLTVQISAASKDSKNPKLSHIFLKGILTDLVKRNGSDNKKKTTTTTTIVKSGDDDEEEEEKKPEDENKPEKPEGEEEDPAKKPAPPAPPAPAATGLTTSNLKKKSTSSY